MTDDFRRNAALALHRFGLGPRPGSIAAIASDPRGALLAELERPNIGRIDDPRLPTSAQAARAAFEARAARRAQQIVAERARKEAERLKASGQNMSDDTAQGADPARPAPPQANEATPTERQTILKEIRAKLDAALAPEIGFAERLTWFWSNHFCVSAQRVPNMAGGYEREAIRPHILGRYVDMLLAVEGHPIFPGAAGENLTVAGLEWDRVMPGVEVRVGAARLRVTSYAAPCENLEPFLLCGAFRRLSQKVHPGWSRVYARVLEAGTVRAGDPVELVGAA